MTIGMYSVKDTIRDQMMPPFLARTEGQAWREYSALIANDEYAKTHAEEYELHYLAEFNDQTGELDTLELPRKLTINLTAIKEETNG